MVYASKTITSAELEELINLAKASELKRSRKLMHSSYDDHIQEMVVVLMRDSVIKPHYHPFGTESYYVIDGELEIRWGALPELREVVILGEPKSGMPFGLRLKESVWHTTRAVTEYVVYVEVGKGPFNEEKTRYD